MKELRCLLRTRLLVVPFKDTADGSGVMTALRAVTSHYVVKPTGLLRNSKGLGGGGSSQPGPRTRLSWLWRRCSGATRCARKTECILSAWGPQALTPTPSPTTEAYLPRPSLLLQQLGGALWVVFLEDCYMKRLSNPLGALQGPQPPGKVAKSVELEKVTEDLATRDSFRHPSAFGRAREIAKAKGHNVKVLLTQGLDQLDLKFLPHYTLRDIRKRKVLSWEDGRFVEVLRPGQKPCDESWAAGLTGAVCREIEARLDADISTKHQVLVHRPQIAPKRKRKEEDEEEEVLEDVQEVDQEEEQPVQQRTLSRAIPATIRRCTEASVPY
ncbi:unnamed protein product [Arctogadus glacialis]